MFQNPKVKNIFNVQGLIAINLTGTILLGFFTVLESSLSSHGLSWFSGNYCAVMALRFKGHSSLKFL